LQVGVHALSWALFRLGAAAEYTQYLISAQLAVVLQMSPAHPQELSPGKHAVLRRRLMERHPEVVFVADDLAAWLIFILRMRVAIG
jgi:hypothetical protein